MTNDFVMLPKVNEEFKRHMLEAKVILKQEELKLAKAKSFFVSSLAFAAFITVASIAIHRH